MTPGPPDGCGPGRSHGLRGDRPSSGAPAPKTARSLIWIVASVFVGSLACDGSGASPASPPAPATPPVSAPGPAPDAVFTLVLPYPRLAAAIETRQVLAAYVSLDDGSVHEVTAETTWTTSEPAVLTIDASGRVRGHARGLATVTGTHDTRSGSIEIEVIAPKPRALSDQPDDLDGPQIHAFYVVPRDGQDRVLDRNAAVASSFQEIQTWTAENLGRRFRLDTLEGELDVTFVRLRETAEEAIASDLITTIQRSISGTGAYADKIRAVYYDGRGEEGFRGRARDRTGVVYLEGERPIGPLFGFDIGPLLPLFPTALEFTMIHELFHTFGAVAPCAPNEDGGRHVSDDLSDIMARNRELAAASGGDGEELVGFTWTVDRERDDYYRHANGDCRDIADSAFWEVVGDVTPRTNPFSAPARRRIPRWPFLDGPLRCATGSF